MEASSGDMEEGTEDIPGEIICRDVLMRELWWGDKQLDDKSELSK